MGVPLRDHQTEHVNRLVSTMAWSTSSFDMSTMGLGKTYTTIECTLRLGLKTMFVICPVSMEKKWRELSKGFGVSDVTITSFAGLRSTGGRQPKHGFLRKVSVLENGVAEEFFEPTDKFRKAVEGGIMVVVDEVHNLKNNSEQYRACKTLTDLIHGSEQEGKSRCMLLSGTPIDKEEQTVRMLRLMGLITEKRLVAHRGSDKAVEFPGAVHLVNLCRERDPGTVSRILRENPTGNTLEVIRLCHILFRDVVCKFWVSTMPSPPTLFEMDAKNGYYKIHEERTRVHLQYYIEQLHSKSGFMGITGTVDGEGVVNIEGGKLGAIIKCLEGIEQSKIPIFERLVRETLVKYPNCKICVGLNYVQRTLLGLVDRLRDLRPEMITGETSKAARDSIIERFQEQNLKSRILIANIKCLSTGIDLDDKTGNFPRIIFASPNYTIVDLHQFSRRFLRVDSKSAPVFRFVYGDCGRKEKSILNALVRKSQIMHEILREQDAAGMKFPGEYEDEIEQ